MRVITREGSQKVRNVERTGRAAVAQVDGGRWLSLEGPARVAREADAVADAVARYTTRYQEPRPSTERVAIEISVERVLGERPAEHHRGIGLHRFDRHQRLDQRFVARR